MKHAQIALLIAAAVIVPGIVPCMAQSPGAAPPPQVAAILNQIAAHEKAFPAAMAKYQPLAETYLQQMGSDPDTVTAPHRDHYFLGRMDFRHGIDSDQFWGVYDRKHSFLGSLFYPYNQEFALQYNATGFVNMIAPDPGQFDTAHYTFAYAGRAFLGDVRCLMFNVTPRRGKGHFIGRIWVEDQEYNIVRFDGTFTPQPRMTRYFHFDSWRTQMNGQWLPVSIYVEEGDVNKAIAGHVSLKGETRFWGYNRPMPNAASDLTDIQVEDGAPVTDASQTNHDLSPLEQQRQWATKAENDVLDRLTQAGLLAPPGEVDKVLETVVNNLEVTNHLNPDPEVRCRVLLTTPLETFTVGHTIVISRGLLDVLPDEAGLAMMLAHELGHIELNHQLNTMYAFDDKMMFPDVESFAELKLNRDPKEESEADAAGVKLLENSPYKDQLGQAGLFLEALDRESHDLSNLLGPLAGNAMIVHGRVARMQALLAHAPALQPRNLQQQAALPLGGRIRIDAWNDNLTLSHAPAAALQSAEDKLAFTITPYEPWLTRSVSSADAAAKP